MRQEDVAKEYALELTAQARVKRAVSRFKVKRFGARIRRRSQLKRPFNLRFNAQGEPEIRDRFGALIASPAVKTEDFLPLPSAASPAGAFPHNGLALPELDTSTDSLADFVSDFASDSVSARRLRHLSQIGLALSAQRDIRRLLAMILSTSRELTTSDGGTLYIIEKDASGEKKLFFRAAQNDSIVVDTNMTFAVAPTSLAGYAAMSGEILRFDDVYHLPPDAPYKFNPLFDLEHGYRTKSVLVVPLQDHNGEMIGVLQLINRKRRRDVLLRDPTTVEREVIGFDEDMAELAATLASQAAVALNNNLLLREIEALFEALVVAASSAIEDRDPSTSGHSKRVTELTLELARAISLTQSGPYKDVHFSPAQLRELRYAALLHDFGKIGVREAILTKSHKIEPTHFEAICGRLLSLRRAWELDAARAQLVVWREEDLDLESKAARAAQLESDSCARLTLLDADVELLRTLNDPSQEGLSDQTWAEGEMAIQRLSALCVEEASGEEAPVLTVDEANALRVRRGTLTPDEFHQIQLHAQMSYEFLEQIPWTHNLENVPQIARAHHERGDGSGYPQGLRHEEIPLGARLMAIADVYDALTATDRPYKRAMSSERALEILQAQAKVGQLDADALDVFVNNRVYLVTAS